MPSSVHDARYQAVIAQLRQAREELGMSQAELAARLGRRQQFVSKYESGERRLDIVGHCDIARHLHIKVSDLWKRLGLQP